MMSDGNHPIRILHVVGGMNRGGVETWLMHILRHIDRAQFRMDFLVHTTQPCAYDDEIRAFGSHVIPCLHPHRLARYVWSFRRILDEYGPYDVIHSHVYLFSGFILWLAARCNIGVRVANIYPTEDRQGSKRTRWFRSLYRQAMINSLVANATHSLFDSEHAQEAFAAMVGRSLPNFSVVYPGIDLSPYLQEIEVEPIRKELDIPFDSKVILTVGRYVPHKNHQHLLQIAEQVLEIRSDVIFLLVGDGPLYPDIRKRVEEMRLDEYFRFVRGRPDIVPLFKAADLFLFPSLMEGFGIVIVEAAAAGLSIVASQIPGILDSAKASPSATLIPPQDTEGFVNAILETLEQQKTRQTSSPSLLAPFDVSTSIENLLNIYETEGL